jgi:hypothetical protein
MLFFAFRALAQEVFWINRANIRIIYLNELSREQAICEYTLAFHCIPAPYKHCRLVQF